MILTPGGDESCSHQARPCPGSPPSPREESLAHPSEPCRTGPGIFPVSQFSFLMSPRQSLISKPSSQQPGPILLHWLGTLGAQTSRDLTTVHKTAATWERGHGHTLLTGNGLVNRSKDLLPEYGIVPLKARTF